MTAIIFNQVSVTNPAQLDELAITEYIFALVAAIVFIGIAVLISRSISFEGGSKARDRRKRRITFWVTCIFSGLLFFLVNFFLIQPEIYQSLKDDFMSTNVTATGFELLLYIVSGFILSKVYRRGKLGNWF